VLVVVIAAAAAVFGAVGCGTCIVFIDTHFYGASTTRHYLHRKSVCPWSAIDSAITT